MRRALPVLLIAGLALSGCASQPAAEPVAYNNIALDSRACSSQASMAGTGMVSDPQTPANMRPYGSLSQKDAYDACMINRGHVPGMRSQNAR